MKQAKRHLDLLASLSRGKVYSRSELALFSNSVDRLLQRLDGNPLEKVGPGLYYYPSVSRFGSLPPDENELLREFLQTKEFLVLSPNLYNSLGLGLTQLSTSVKVYNHKRHATLNLANRQYEFKRPHNGFPKHVSKEFLLVDLLNNLHSVGESPKELLKKIKDKLPSFDFHTVLKMADMYGKIATKKFFRALQHDSVHSQS